MGQGYEDIESSEIGLDVFMHSQRVATYTKQLSQSMNYTSKQIDYIVMAALNHDIGKSRISRNILNKEGSLTNAEFEQIKKHALYSADILKNYNHLQSLLNVVEMHHENYDGSGYYNISGDKIPIESRIIRITDVYDALTSDRCYRKSFTKKEALTIMEKEKQIYDKDILEQFFKIKSEECEKTCAFENIYVQASIGL